MARSNWIATRSSMQLTLSAGVSARSTSLRRISDCFLVSVLRLPRACTTSASFFSTFSGMNASDLSAASASANTNSTQRFNPTCNVSAQEEGGRGIPSPIPISPPPFPFVVLFPLFPPFPPFS